LGKVFKAISGKSDLLRKKWLILEIKGKSCMEIKIDDIDCAIVALLQEDGRMSCPDIAKRIGFITTRVVRYRLDKLTQNGVIKVSAIVNPESVGYSVKADVWLEVETGLLMKVVEELTQMPEVSYIACSTGDRDISMQVYGREIKQLYQVVTEKIGLIPGVKKANMVIVPLVVRDVYTWSIPMNSHESETLEGDPLMTRPQ
jgi:Lrp/AsnC family transcriptional regulator, regulator for asnA, asnC and gidA